MMASYYLGNGSFSLQINLYLNQNQNNIAIETNINCINYSLFLCLQELYKHPYFQRCYSLFEAFNFFCSAFQDNRVFINGINNDEINLGIYAGTNNNYLFRLCRKINPNFEPHNYNNVNNINHYMGANMFNPLYRGNDANHIDNQIKIISGGDSGQMNYSNEMEKSNPMCKAMRNIILPGQKKENLDHEINMDTEIISGNKFVKKKNIKNDESELPNPIKKLVFKYDRKNKEFIKIRIFMGKDNNLCQIENVNGFLKICLMKILSYFLTEEIFNYNIPQNFRDIFLKLKNGIHFTGDNNINIMMQENRLINILPFYQYLINSIINSNLIYQVINQFLNQNQKWQIENYWRNLSKYEPYSSFLENQFLKDIKNSKFDYHLISINLLERDGWEEYERKKRECPNVKRKIVYCPAKINPFTAQNEENLEYAKKNNYGKGFYFLDSIDNILSYYELENNGSTVEKIIPQDFIFSVYAIEIFYDSSKVNIFEEDKNLYNQILNNCNLKEKTVEKNGLHLIKKNSNNKTSNRYNIYVISDECQAIPLYTFTFKRNGTCILWRDPNFKRESEFSNFLKEIESLNSAKTNMNFYYESSTEEALKFILRRKFDKIILITSIGKDLSGKRFVEISRKILGSDIIVLFFSNNANHLNWIQNFNNCLYTNRYDIYEKYITNYNETDLKNLKEIVEQAYNISLKQFTVDFLSYPKFKKEGDYSSLNYSSPYIRNVYIKIGNKYLCMTNQGQVIINNERCAWDITVYENDITFFSNGFYLDLSADKENVIGFEFMKAWNFEKNNGYYYLINKEKNEKNILSFENGEIKVNKDFPGENELFELIDKLEE